jgi:hypothetical protein
MSAYHMGWTRMTEKGSSQCFKKCIWMRFLIIFVALKNLIDPFYQVPTHIPDLWPWLSTTYGKAFPLFIQYFRNLINTHLITTRFFSTKADSSPPQPEKRVRLTRFKLPMFQDNHFVVSLPQRIHSGWQPGLHTHWFRHIIWYIYRTPVVITWHGIFFH